MSHVTDDQILMVICLIRKGTKGVRQHLKECPDCQARESAMRTILKADIVQEPIVDIKAQAAWEEFKNAATHPDSGR